MPSPRAEAHRGCIEDASSPTAPSKDRSAVGLCQVEGCGASLLNLRDYYVRYRICELHSTVESVIGRDGQLQRFCQQCGRFHPQTAFDGTKRSCREGLARHNARRRRSSSRRPNSASTQLAIAELTGALEGSPMLYKGGTAGGSGWELYGETGSASHSSPLFTLQPDATTGMTSAHRSMPLCKIDAELGGVFYNTSLTGMPSVASQHSPQQLASWQADTRLPATMLRASELPAAASHLVRLSSANTSTTCMLERNPFPTGDHTAATGNLQQVQRRPVSWPTALTPNQALPQAMTLACSTRAGASAQEPDPQWGLQCLDIADEDMSMWDILCNDSVASQPAMLGHAAASGFRNQPQPNHQASAANLRLAGHQNDGIRVLGENQSLQSLWDNLQSNAAMSQAQVGPSAVSASQYMAFGMPGTHSGTGVAMGAAARVGGSILDTDVSMTTMLLMEEPEQQNIKCEGYHAHHLQAMQEGHVPAVPATVAGLQARGCQLDAFYGFSDMASPLYNPPADAARGNAPCSQNL